MDNKVKVSQDTLFKYWKDHHLKLVRLSELTGMSEATINVCFKHYPGNNGQPRVFTPDGIVKINEALPRLADAIRGSVMTFGSDRVFTNTHNNTYDPALVEPMKHIGEYINISAMVRDVLGWAAKKKDAILVSTASKVYGNISEEDMVKINNELLAIAGVLSSYEVVADSDSSLSVG